MGVAFCCFALLWYVQCVCVNDCLFMYGCWMYVCVLCGCLWFDCELLLLWFLCSLACVGCDWCYSTIFIERGWVDCTLLLSVGWCGVRVWMLLVCAALVSGVLLLTGCAVSC